MPVVFIKLLAAYMTSAPNKSDLYWYVLILMLIAYENNINVEGGRQNDLAQNMNNIENASNA
ncbi:hypothetical protein ATHL_00024 [Anaerolinea thermolimosa]|nr:hypothetical protein ATHL_00024 [Anaerolinea thermolimosa]